MRITIREQNLTRDFILLLLLLSTSGAAFYFWLDKSSARTAGGFALAALIALVLLLSSELRPLISIDHNGIFDRRLGVGTIRWHDIKAVQITGGYGHRLLDLRLHNPELYLRRARGFKQNEYRDCHALGFSGFKLDLRDVDLNLLDLQRIIESRIERHSELNRALSK